VNDGAMGDDVDDVDDVDYVVVVSSELFFVTRRGSCY